MYIQLLNNEQHYSFSSFSRPSNTNSSSTIPTKKKKQFLLFFEENSIKKKNVVTALYLDTTSLFHVFKLFQYEYDSHSCKH